MTIAIILELLFKLCWEDELVRQKQCYRSAIQCVNQFRGKVSGDDIFFNCAPVLLTPTSDSAGQKK